MRRNCAAAQSREPSAGSSSLSADCVRTLELFQGSCVHVGYSLSDNGTVSRSGSLRKSYVAEKVFFCPQKRARAAVSIAISYRLFYV